MMSALGGARADKLHERLCEAARPAALFRILERVLLARLKQPLLIHPMVAHALARAHWQHVRVGDVRRERDISPRHFISLFHTAVGLTPGRYFRVRRFGQVLRALARNGPHDLADLAIWVGYANQSHLIREFREHAGMTPTEYRPANPASPFHHLNRNQSRRAS